MKFNLHTHTYRCHHADGADEEYVKSAIAAGYQMIGFSDHAPYIFPTGHKSTFRVDYDMASDYAQSVSFLKQKYSDKIDIKLGFEVEWYPNLVEKELEYLRTFKYDFIILAQHYTDNEYESFAKYTGSATDDSGVLRKYVRQITDGAKSGAFTYVCHPDLINFTGSQELYVQQMTYMLNELKKLEIPLEYNFYGYYDNRQYPNDVFWRLVKETGNPVVIGLDAHHPWVYTDKRLDAMKEHMKELGLKAVDSIELTDYKGAKTQF
ncbi:MAG: histidinol-phosphatase [Clostridiales bacterium]|nr:histidinol-phosphatase [Clostridiales bacterium]